MKLIKNLLIAAVLITSLSCEKEPGEGGTSSIQGKILTVNLNAEGDTVVAPYYAMDQDVYIIYGENDQTYDDKFSTSLDGSYRFDYLTPGTYTVFAYSECKACPGEMEAVKQTVEISGKKQVINLDDLIVIE